MDEKLRNSLFSLGTYLFGRSATIQEARELGELLWRNEPFRVKHYRKVWGREDNLLFPRDEANRAFLRELFPTYPYYVLSTEPEFMSIDDQREEAANRLLTDLGLFEFFLRPSLREGEVSSDVYQVNLASMVTDNATGEVSFPNQDVLAQVRSLLESTSGMPVKTLLAEQDALLPTAKQEMPRPKTPSTAPASPQPSVDGASTIHPPLPPRRERIG